MFDHFLEHLKEDQMQKGQHDRDAGILPASTDFIYLEGYLQGRPEGVDGIIQYFPSKVEQLREVLNFFAVASPEQRATYGRKVPGWRTSFCC